MTVSDSGFTTTTKNPGESGIGNLSLPWVQFDAANQAGKTGRARPEQVASLLSMGRRALVSAWWWPDCADPRGVPLLWGAIGEREDTWLDTSFPLYSPLTLLASRYAIRDGAFHDGVSHDTVAFEGMSLRGLCSELGSLATEQKLGGQLPIDWTYKGERGAHQRTNYQAWNAQNLSIKKLLTNISNVKDGPDMCFRPYWADDQHVRVRFLAGSDADIRLDEDHPPLDLDCRPDGGSLDDMKVSYALPVQRVYATGAGQDESVVTALAEDLTQVTSGQDPPILREAVYSDTDVTDQTLLKRKAQGVLDGCIRPLMQITGSIDADDTDQAGRPLHPLGAFWPGERAVLHLTGFRSLPDDGYQLRLMEISGDQTSRVSLKFDVTPAPY